MRLTVIAVFLGVVLCHSTTVSAQQADAGGYAYVTYFECDAALEFRADEIVARNYKPHYDAAVEAGEIISWSWLSHYVGGEWRRVLLLTAMDMDTLLSAAGALGEAIQQTTPQSGRDFTEVCNRHVDYIWEAAPEVGGTPPGSERGDAGFSTYFGCNVNREAEADALVRDVMGPIYNRHVAEGGLTSWTWLKHNVGGQWRRLLSLTASDHMTMMETRAAVLAEIQSGRNQRRYEAFNDICPDHEDYMWDIQIENP